MPSIGDAKILIIATDGYERSELREPLEQLRQKGATVHVASPDGGDIRSWDQKDWGDSVASDLTLSDVNIDDYHALVIPGGQINPDILRTKPEAVSIVQQAVRQGLTVAAVCHGPWLLAEADVIRGRDVTSWPSIRTDLRNAGANVHDKEVVTDHGIITSRKPDDLPAFIAKIVEEIEEGRHDRAAA